MRKSILFALTATMLVTLFMTPAVNAQAKVTAAVNVTFVLNTASQPDTVTGYTNVTVTGNSTAITGWGNGVALTRIGGDYWKTTVQFNAGDTVNYKYRISGGWESDLAGVGYGDNGNRHLVVGSKDTTLPLEFYNGSGSKKQQYWKPWGTSPDTMKTIYFRVNMLGFTSKPFNSSTDTVGVRGDKKGGSWGDPNFGWSPTRYLTREGTSGMPGFIWSGAIKLNKSKVASGDSAEYKFLIGYDWGKDEAKNRGFVVPAGNDTTLYWVWYNNEAPIVRVNPDTVAVTFVANMTTASQKQSFSLGDTVQVQAGWFGTADSVRTYNLVKQGGTQNYAATVTMITKIGALLDYQYYLVKNGQAIREYYFNFGYNGAINAEQERRQVVVSAKTMTVSDNVVSVTDPRRQPYFQNQRKLSKTVVVTWEVNLKPAYYAVWAGRQLVDGQGTLTVTKVDSIKKWGVAINGPGADPAAGGWATWGATLVQDTTHRMYDDGTHGDKVAGDTIYTRLIQYTTANTVGEVFKFGVGGGDNESGFGLNHMENIDDTNPTYTLHTQFGSINPTFYNAWDFTNEHSQTPTGVLEVAVPEAYNLAQNYPNPFNPSTKIEFALPAQSHVTLTIFNILGQEVARVIDGTLNAGTHQVTFDASKLTSGVYFYQINAGNFNSMKKMVLIK